MMNTDMNNNINNTYYKTLERLF